MADKRKQRIKALATELGIGHRAAANILDKRTACSRAGHVANRDVNGEKCTDCGAPLTGSNAGGENDA